MKVLARTFIPNSKDDDLKNTYNILFGNQNWKEDKQNYYM